MTGRPIVLLGEFSTGKALASPYLRRHGWGRMWVTKGPYFDYEGEPYGLDNGAFSCWRKGRLFDEAAFLRRLDASIASGVRPLVAIAPDIVAGGLVSLEFSLRWRERLPEDIPWYLAVQDGICPQDVGPIASRFAGIFLGGSDAYKRTALAWRHWSNAWGLPLHFARCGTLGKLREAVAIGADSVDSALPVRQLGMGDPATMNLFERVWLGECPQRELAFD